MGYVHLHVHSYYSLLDGASKITDLLDTAKKMDQRALAITDHGVMYGVIEFYLYAKKINIKPIIGCELYLANNSMHEKRAKIDDKRSHLTVLCKNELGYHNLTKIVSKSFTEGFYYKPRIDIELISKYKEGLIVLSGCSKSRISQYILNNEFDKALKTAEIFKEIFKDDFYLEIADHGSEEETKIIENIRIISKKTEIPIVATNDIHYVREEDAFTQDVLLCIGTNQKIKNQNRFKFDTKELFMKSEYQMRQIFSNDIEAIENTLKIAEKCDIQINFNKSSFPLYNGNEFKNSKEKSFILLKKLCEENLNFYFENDKMAKERLKFELSVIKKMGFVDYFLIVYDIVKYAKNNGIFVGPARGSAAGSIVSYLLNITTVNPIKYGLFFERFLNTERTSMPDIDIDFCYKRREEVIKYVKERYGENHVSSIITFGTMGIKQAIKDIARVFDYPFSYINMISRSIPDGSTLEKISPFNKIFRDFSNNQNTKKIVELAKKIEGFPRHVSVHASGIIITKNPIDDHLPVKITKDMLTTQYDVDTVQKLGFLKIDFLGLRALTIIKDTLDNIKLENSLEIDIEKIDFEDTDVYKMISEGNNAGVFQMEGDSDKKKFLKRMSLRCFSDLVASISLYRPGAITSIEQYLENKNSEKINYDHISLIDLLKDTYGCIIYQEQIISIFEKIAGYSKSQADIIRRCISKKSTEIDIENEKNNFIYGFGTVNGALKNGVSLKSAINIFEKLKEMSKYTFNKSHAVGYSKIAYQTAWLKFHYKTEFMASVLNNWYNFKTISAYVKECKNNGIKLLVPDINKSTLDFKVSNNSILFSFKSIKNVGESFINNILKEREKGLFKNFDDFFKRVKGNKKLIEWLIKAGAFDNMNERKNLLDKYKDLLENKKNSADISGQINMFNDFDVKKPAPKKTVRTIKKEVLAMEKEALNCHITD